MMGFHKGTNGHEGYRLLTLEGQVGAVYCRVHDPQSRRTLPRKNEHGTWEFATRSLLRMKNLVVCRQIKRGSSMIGPGDYFCNLDDPERHSFTVHLPTASLPPHQRFPQFKAHPIGACAKCDAGSLRPIHSDDVLEIDATWISCKRHADAVKAKVQDYASHGVSAFGNSLFPDPGLLECSASGGGALPPQLRLPAFDATAVDLHSAFHCRLVRNDTPFSVIEPGAVVDDLRPVTYDFQRSYAHEAVHGEGAGGLFLETHDFTQTMTPANPDSCGFIVLGRWMGGEDGPSPRRLQLAAVRVPYGWTLVVGKGALHGDTTFLGSYIMAMTSDHVLMASADTVFMKDAATMKNVDIVCPEHNMTPLVGVGSEAGEAPVPIVPPIVVYRNATRDELDEFKRVTKGASFMLQPFSKLSWTTTLYRRIGWYPGVPKGDTQDATGTCNLRSSEHPPAPATST